MNNISGIPSRPSTILPSLLQTKREFARRLSQAVEEGLKELPGETKGNTIVHDAVHLHDYNIFKKLFRDKIGILEKYINLPNAEGATPLLEATKAGDLQITKALIKAGAADSKTMNQEDNNGLTPLHAAVQSGNVSLVKYLINHGAWINKPIPKTNLLHTAVSNKDEEMVKFLLKWGAKELVNKADSVGLTPKQRAIISGQVSLVKLMLEANPEIAKTINQPDSFGITDLQRAARSGNMEMMSLLLSYCAEEEIKVNPEAFFTTGDLEACEAPSELEKVDSIDIEKIAFPLTVIQNYCSVMVGLADGKVLQIRNADAKQVRDMLMQKKYGPEWKSDQGANVLTMFLSPGHGFLRLQCQKCDDNKPYNMNSGFYPKGQKLAESRILFLERQRQALREQQIDKPLESGKETDGQFYPGNVLIEAINMMKGMRFFI